MNRRIRSVGSAVLLAGAVVAGSSILAGMSTQRSEVQDPAGLLANLVGTWEVYTYPLTGGQPLASGTRVFRAGLNELVLEWEERFHDSDNVGRGFLGFDSRVSRYYLLAVYSQSGSSVTFLSGELRGSLIRWTPVAVDPDQTAANRGLIQSDLTGIRRDTLSWRAFDDRWEVLLIRH